MKTEVFVPKLRFGVDSSTSINFKELAVTEEVKKVMFMFHGYGSDMESMVTLFYLIGVENVIFIAPDGIEECEGSQDLQVSSGIGRQWFALKTLDIEILVPLLVKASATMSAFIASQLKRLGLEAKDAIIMGFSQGAILSCQLGAVAQDPFAGVISCSGGFIPTPEDNLNAVKTPYTIIHGKADYVLQDSWSIMAEKQLKKQGHSVEAFYIDGMGHEINEEVIGIINRSVKRYSMQ